MALPAQAALRQPLAAEAADSLGERAERPLQAPQVEQAALREPPASQPQAAVQLQDASQAAVWPELQPKLAASPELRVSPRAPQQQGAEAQPAQADASVVQPQPLSSA